ncbi:MAG: malto-oligosyltrehalose trehalohydrolase [Gammaproteobacteria bacterium]
MVQRAHYMPFGTQILADGRVRFRLWAPSASQVELCLESPQQQAVLPMDAEPEGWFSLVTDLAAQGAPYRFRINGGLRIPDPASRFQPEDVHGPSQVIDPQRWDWQDAGWRGRPWEEAVIYELHVGTFTLEGTFSAAQERLDYLQQLGVTAVELMPVADFPGHHNWGYDGVLLFAPDSRYGKPEDLKAFVQAAHDRGLMVFLDVVYNHFGPEGNYLHTYASLFFTERHHTPWGATINFDSENSYWVRQFFIHNALFWLEEYHLDGLRLDAVHAIIDDSDPDILIELAETVHRHLSTTRLLHLILENYDNAARYLRREPEGQPQWYVAQWNDDIHHALHVLTTGETAGFYADYSDDPGYCLRRCLSEGFAYQGEPSQYLKGRRRGEPSTDVPATAFVSLLQNHDQVGNRALGERITALADDKKVRVATAIVLLAPSPPLLFMGQEWGARQPFLFFCDLGDDLAESITEGRRREFAAFPEFSDPAARERIPDPMASETFNRSRLDWSDLKQPPHDKWLTFHRELLALRHAEILPRLPGIKAQQVSNRALTSRALEAQWTLGDGTRLMLFANLSNESAADVSPPLSRLIFADSSETSAAVKQGQLPAWSVAWFLDHPFDGAP